MRWLIFALGALIVDVVSSSNVPFSVIAVIVSTCGAMVDAYCIAANHSTSGGNLFFIDTFYHSYQKW